MTIGKFKVNKPKSPPTSTPKGKGSRFYQNGKGKNIAIASTKSKGI
tara:strand:+ start:611 stop:748 length:138 start_codon:yes stop_codon:yes gene_type:complete